MQRLVQRAPGSGQSLDEILADLSSPPPAAAFVAAIRRESPDTGLAVYLLPSVREQIRSAYNDKDARRILGTMLRQPYISADHPQSILYQYLGKAEKDEVNKATDARFVAETGIKGALDWNNAADRPFARRWLMLRDDVMDDRAMTEEVKRLKTELLAKASSPADLHLALRGLDDEVKIKLLMDTGFKKSLKSKLGDWDEFAGCIEDLGARALNKAELATHSTVVAALNEAWKDSLPDADLAESREQIDTRNHEEGGWIYVNLVTGAIVTRRQSAKDHTMFERDSSGNLVPSISLELPPVVDDSVLIANFHTHPNQSRYAGASGFDGRSIDSKQVPGLLFDSEGIGAYGSTERRKTLRGSRTYPE